MVGTRAALRWSCARALGLTPDEVAVFGDSDNDLPTIDAVPNSVAVANANEAVTAAARWHIAAPRQMMRSPGL